MNIIDSSGWLEYFANTKNANHFQSAIENTDLLLVPTITFYEVFKKLLYITDEQQALKQISFMSHGTIVDININLSLEAAKLGKKHKLPMADSIIYATTLEHNATLWTQDRDFKGLDHVKYFEKK